MSKSTPTSRPLNSRLVTNQFRALRTRHLFTHLEAYLLFELVACCEQEGWPAEFYLSNAVLAGALGCSEPGLIKARNRLADVGLLNYTSGNRRTPTAYRLLVPTQP
jgi:hypothetical protein